MTFPELASALYEDLNGAITRIESTANGRYLVWLECDNWECPEERRRFLLDFGDVAETKCDTGFCAGVSCATDHELLWDHNHPHESVYFSSAPVNPYEVLGRVYSAHFDLLGNLRAMDMYWHADPEILRGGQGMLFQGPRPIVEAYCRAIDGLLIYNRIDSYTPKLGFKVFDLDGKFVVAKSVELIELVDQTNCE